MRRILFLSVMAVSSLSWSWDEGGSEVDFLKSGRDALDGMTAGKRAQALKDEYRDLRDELDKLKKESPDKTGDDLNAQINNLKDEKTLIGEVDTALNRLPAIGDSAWKRSQRMIGNQNVSGYIARLGDTPFTVFEYKNSEGKVIQQVIYTPEAVEGLDSNSSRDFRDGRMTSMKLSPDSADYKSLMKLLDAVNDEAEKEAPTDKSGEDLKPGSKAMRASATSEAPLYGKKVRQVLADRRNEIGDESNLDSDLGNLYHDQRVAKNGPSRDVRRQMLTREMALVDSLQKGSINLKADTDVCAALIKATRGGYDALSPEAKEECKSSAPAPKKDEKEVAADKAAEQAKQKQDDEYKKQVDQLVGQNMALCRAMLQRSSAPMPPQTQNSLANMFQGIMMNSNIVCPTFGLVMSDVAAENFNSQTGQGGFKSAVDRELAEIDGMPPGPQMEFIGNKADRVIQDHFKLTYSKTSARGNMKDAQLAQNAQDEKEHMDSLKKEKSCLEGMANGFVALLQSKHAMQPANEEEAAAVQRIAQYNSLVKYLLGSVNKEIDKSNLSGVDFGSDQNGQFRPSNGSVRFRRNNVNTGVEGQPVFNNQVPPNGAPIYNNQNLPQRVPPTIPSPTRMPGSGAGVYGI